MLLTCMQRTEFLRWSTQLHAVIAFDYAEYDGYSADQHIVLCIPEFFPQVV